jgi:hypothetical protein
MPPPFTTGAVVGHAPILPRPQGGARDARDGPPLVPAFVREPEKR